MFLKATTPPPIGTTVRIDLTLPSASVIVLTGVVDRHLDDPQRGRGVELKLAPIPAGSVWLIESALAAEKRQATSGPMYTRPATPAGVRGEPVASADGDAVVEAESELLTALTAEAESFKKLNPFLVLGVSYNANDQEVRVAFGELTKRYHPDRFARYESADLRQIAAEIFILIRDAYRRLGDAAGRASALAAIGKPITVPAPRPTPPPEGVRKNTPPSGIRKNTPAGGVRKDTPAGGVSRRTVGVVHDAGTVRRPPEPALLEERPTPKPNTVEIPEARPPANEGETTARLPGGPDAAQLEEMLEAGRFDEALAAFRAGVRRSPSDRTMRAGVELCEGLLALAGRDRLEAAQRFEAALEIDPSNERAARELADMRRQATNERKGLLSRLMGKKE